MKTAYINGRNIWPPIPPDSFHVQFVDAATGLPIQGAITPKWTTAGPNLEYKTGKGNWTEFASGTQITSEPDGIIHFRGTGRTALYLKNTGTSWVTTQPFIVRGRMANLLDWEHAETVIVSEQGFAAMFSNTKILEAHLFYNPVAGGSAPNYSIFSGCTMLRKFVCTGMKDVMENTYAYGYCFQNCTAFTYVDIDFLQWGSGTSANTENWFWTNWSSTGTFYKPASLPDERGTKRIPSGWTVVNNK
jgi:hypothetical protein